ncbi:MAG: peptidoglycan DD-metalloendopeptidase family protein [Succinivibrio sp.]
MKSEDYVSSEALCTGTWRRPLPRRHTAAAAATLCAAALLSLLSPSRDHQSLPQQEEAQDAFTVQDPSMDDPSVPLVQALAESQNQGGAQDAAAEHGSGRDLDNYDDTIPDGALSDSDDAMDREVRSLAARDNGDKAQVELKWYEEDVQKGDTISSIFSDLNIPPAVTMAILDNKKVAGEVNSLSLGEHISFLLDDQSRLMAFVKPFGKKQQIRFYRSDPDKDSFDYVIEPLGSHLKDGEITEAVKPSEIASASKEEKEEKDASQGSKPKDAALAKAQDAKDAPKADARSSRGRLVVVAMGKGDTFSSAANRAGVSYSEINQILAMFKGRIQFSRNVRAGDTVRVLFTDKGGKGRISAVEFSLQGRKVSAFLNSKDGKFYDERGLNSKSASGFRRFPFQGRANITSPFNPARVHPVTGVVRPHYGTDFGMPIGTPIVAPADGVVVKSAFTRSTGYYIVLRHRGAYSTVYMHLSKSLVRQGQSVKMGSVIARSGNTGLSTGPHLHYELRINGRPVNAMRVRLNGVQDSVAAADRKRFAANIQAYKRDLHNQKLVASR